MGEPLLGENIAPHEGAMPKSPDPDNAEETITPIHVSMTRASPDLDFEIVLITRAPFHILKSQLAMLLAMCTG